MGLNAKVRNRPSEPKPPGLRVGNFHCIARNGFGDPGNAYPHSMAWFKDHLYVGTTRHNIAMIYYANIHAPGLVGPMVWPVKVPESYRDLDLQAQIWRYDPRNDDWHQVYISPMVRGNEGFDVPMSIGFRVMTVFQGKSDPEPALYVASWTTSHRPEMVLLRSLNGTDFEPVSEPGLGISDPIPRTVRCLTPFKGRLFTGPAMGTERGRPNTAGGAVVYANSDPARGLWQLACEPNFGNPNNLSIFKMATFNGYLYASTVNVQDGFEVWKTDGEGEPPFRWTPVISKGAYRGKLNQIGMSMEAFEGHLYVGTAIQSGGYDRVHQVGPALPELIRLAPDDSWDLVVGEPRITPDKLAIPLSGMGAGFDKFHAGYFWQMGVHDGWLYLSDSGWGAFRLFVDDGQDIERFDEESTERRYQKYLRKYGGFSLWRTADGIQWVPVTLDGFGSCFNVGVRNMVSTPHGFFLGVANSFGPQIAKRRVAGWTYEPNPRAGLEIWWKKPDDSSLSTADSLRCLERTNSPEIIKLDKGREVEEKAVHHLVRDFYQGSDFRNVGFWSEDTDNGKLACINLVDEILAFLPEKDKRILDLNCGYGATTGQLLKRFPPESVFGVTQRKQDLEACSRNAPGATFFQMKFSKLPFLNEVFDYAICLEGLGRLKARVTMLREIYRILREPGTCVFTDILYRSEPPRFPWSRRDLLEHPDDYRQLLAAMGFRDVKVVVLTSQCWIGFSQQLQKYFDKKILQQQIHPQVLPTLRKDFPGGRGRVTHYVLVVAQKLSKNLLLME